MPSYNSAALLGGRYLEKGSAAAKARMAYLRSLKRGRRMYGGYGEIGGKRRTRTLRGGGSTAEAVFGLVGKALGFWGNWGKTNIGQLVSYIKNKKQRQKIIDEIKKLSPKELKRFQEMMRKKRDSGMTTEQILSEGPPKPPPPAPIQQKSAVELAKEEALRQLEEAKQERDKRLLEIMNKRFERSKRQKKQIISQTVEDDYDYDEHQPETVGEMEEMIDDTEDMAYNPRYMQGGKLKGRDWLDIFLGPYGWAALASRKIQEKKEKKQKEELDKLMYGDK